MNANRGFYAGSRPPVIKPIDACGRGLYETGRPPSVGGTTAPNFNTPELPTLAWESTASIASQPGWLMYLHAVCNPLWLDPSQYILIYDLNPMNATQLAMAVAAGSIARYTLGPPNATGGTIIYESSAEVVPIIDNTKELWAFGLPFNFGIIAVASSTPRVLTPANIPVGETGVVSIVARVQT